MKKTLVFYLSLLFTGGASAATTTLFLEDFDSYTAPLALTDAGSPAMGELTNSYPATTVWQTEGSDTQGESRLKSGGAGGTANYLEIERTGGAQYDVVVRFPDLNEQYLVCQFYISVPAGQRMVVLVEDHPGDLEGFTINFENGTATFSGGGGSTTYTQNSWVKVKIFVNQNNTAKSNNASYDILFNDVQVASDVNFQNNWSGKKIGKLTFSARTVASFSVDNIQFYSETNAPVVTDTVAPQINFNSGTSFTSLQNPHLGLAFTDSGTGADLNLVRYRVGSASANPNNFTSNGTTSIGTDLTGTAYSPAAIRISDTHFNGITSQGTETFYVDVLDDAGNVTQSSFTITKSEPESSIPTGGTIYPSLVKASTQASVTFAMNGYSTVDIYSMTGRKLASLAANGAETVSWNLLTTGGAKAGSGIYMAVFTSNSERRVVKFAVVR